MKILRQTVTGCLNCPLSGVDHNSNTTNNAPCHHPKAPKYLNINPCSQSIPSLCPLRETEVLVAIG